MHNTTDKDSTRFGYLWEVLGRQLIVRIVSSTFLENILQKHFPSLKPFAILKNHFGNHFENASQVSLSCFQVNRNASV